MKHIVFNFCLSLLLALPILASCGNDDESFFSKDEYSVNCYIDSDKVYLVSDMIGRELVAGCEMENKHDDVASLERDPQTGRYYILPKRIGSTYIKLNVDGSKSKIYVRVVTAATDSWLIQGREEDVECDSHLKEAITEDLYVSHVFPKLEQEDNFSIAMSYRPHFNCKDDILLFDYDRLTGEYTFYSIGDLNKKQVFKFYLDDKKVGEEDGGFVKSGTFVCDLTEWYKEKYGNDLVQRVVLRYKVGKPRIYF